MSEQENYQLHIEELPGGTVTFMFTDIEGSTKLLEQLRDKYATLLANQRRIFREAFSLWHGQEVDTQGDAFFVAFPRATDAVAASVHMQRSMAANKWPEDVEVRVRMGLHTGEPLKSDEGYIGMDVHRAARIAHVGHGGQVLLSETTASLIPDELPEGVSLLDLGRHLLKDMKRPEHIRQLEIEDLPSEFSPLKSLERLPPAELREPRQVGECPYRGLAAFREGDTQFFYGRETFTERLEVSVKTKPLVAVIVGSSGSGKSSAVFAGLLPRLRQTGSWQIAVTRPGDQPFYSLASTLSSLLSPELGETDRLVETRKLTDNLMSGEVNLYRVVERILEKEKQNEQILLVIDQFEELYTLCPDVATRQRFIDELLSTEKASSERRLSPVVILLTMRADFMGLALSHRPFADALQEASLIMGPMNQGELRAAIEKPAEAQGAAFEPGLVERILDDVGQEPGNLPLLEFALTLLWERQTDGWLTHEDYEAIGCVEGALASYADEVYAGLDESERQAAHKIFVQLVRPGEGTEDTRRLATHAELGEVSWGLVQYLADKRLVVTGRDASSGEETVEVVHEALIQRWGQLRNWMTADRAFRNWQEGLRAALRSWQNSGSDDGALLRGTPLAQAREWLTDRGDEIVGVEKTYIQTSIEFQEKRQRERQRRRRLIFGGLVAGLVVTILLSVFALQQRQASLRQSAILLAGQAEAELANGYHDRAVLLALTALEDFPYTPQAEHALGQAVSYNRALQQYTGHDGAVTSAAWSPDGTRVATSGTDNSVHIWDAASGEELQVIDLPEGITGNIYDYGLAVKWSPDGEHLLTVSGDRFLLGSQDYDLMLWEVSPSGKTEAGAKPVLTIEIANEAEPEEGEGIITTFGVHYATGAAADFAPQSGRLVTVGGDNTAIVWDASLKEQELVLAGHGNDVSAVDWSPDEARLATASEDGTARMWDAQTGEMLQVLEGHEGAVNSVAWSPDGAQLATAGDDGTVRFWDAVSHDEGEATGELLGTIEPQAGVVSTLAWSPDGSYLATGTDDGRVRIWRISQGDATSGEVIAELGGHIDFVAHLAWSPIDDRLVSAGADGVARVLNASPSTAEQILPFIGVSDMSWSSDGSHLALPVSFGEPSPGTVAIWDVSADQLVTDELDAGYGYYWFEADYSPDDRLLQTRGISSYPEGIADAEVIHVIDVWTGQEIKSFSATGGSWLRANAWSTDGTQVAGGTFDGILYIWDYQTGKLLKTLDGYEGEKMISGIEWSPDGSKIAMADGPTAQVLDAATGEKLFVLDHDPSTYVWSVVWSPDGARMLTTSGEDDVGAEDTTVRVWDGKTGEELLVIRGHTSQVTLGTWSPDGRRIVTSSSDSTTRVWDAETGDELLTLSTPAIYMPFARWSPDGKYVAVGLETTPAEIWRVWQTTDELISYAKECCLIRDLTPDELQQYGLTK